VLLVVLAYNRQSTIPIYEITIYENFLIIYEERNFFTFINIA